MINFDTVSTVTINEHGDGLVRLDFFDPYTETRCSGDLIRLSRDKARAILLNIENFQIKSEKPLIISNSIEEFALDGDYYAVEIGAEDICTFSFVDTLETGKLATITVKRPVVLFDTAYKVRYQNPSNKSRLSSHEWREGLDQPLAITSVLPRVSFFSKALSETFEEHYSSYTLRHHMSWYMEKLDLASPKRSFRLALPFTSVLSGFFQRRN